MFTAANTSRVKHRRSILAVWLMCGAALLCATPSFAQGKAPTLVLAQTEPAPGIKPRLNTTGRDVLITVPLHEFGPLGQVQIRITPNDEIFLSASDLFAALSRVVNAGALAPLTKIETPGGEIPLAQTAAAGFPIVYDAALSELTIHIPLSARTAQTIAFGPGNEAVTIEPDRSSTIGAFLNYRIGESYQFSGTQKDEAEFLGDFELGGRVAQTLAFDNFFSYSQGAQTPFVRSASQLIYDLPGPALRITAGDLVTQTTAFQSDPQISGLNVSHLISNFFPTFNSAATSTQTLVLTRESDVQILINNLPVTQLHLGPGSYDLRNFPLVQGANNVRAIITDDTGQRRVVDFSFFSDVNLLAPGIAEYTATVGILAPPGDSGPHYETNEPAFSGFYRRGLTNQITAGVNLQADKDDQIFGVDGAFGTDYGLFGLNIAGNHSKAGSGAAIRVQYQFSDNTNSEYFARTYQASAEWRSEHFTDLIDFNGLNSQEAIFALNITQPLSNAFSLQFSGNFTKSRLSGQDEGSASAFLTWQAPLETTVSGGLTYEWAPKPIPGIPTISERGLSLAIAITHRFDATTLADASADRFRQHADFTRSPVNPIDDWFANGDFTHTKFGYVGNATAGYETNRGNIEGTYTTSLNPDGSVASQQVGAFFDGSVDFADGKFALGQHVTDSFAIIDEDPSLEGRQVIVQSQFANQDIARTDFLGPAVVPIASYNKQVIPYDVKDLPPGYDLGAGNFEIYSWYHAGTSRTVGSPYNVTALGNLLDDKGVPLSLRTGTARSLTDKDAPSREVITNRSGRFAAIGLSPGTWRIVMSGGVTYEITITKQDGMLVRVGNLKPVSTQGETP